MEKTEEKKKHEPIVLDRKGNRLEVGSRVYIRGTSEDSGHVYFNNSMTSYLNNGLIYEISEIKYNKNNLSIISLRHLKKGKVQWVWSPNNLEVYDDSETRIKLPKPKLFDPSLLNLEK